MRGKLFCATWQVPGEYGLSMSQDPVSNKNESPEKKVLNKYACTKPY